MTTAEKIGVIVRAARSLETDQLDSRRQLVSAIGRFAKRSNKRKDPLDSLLKRFARSNDFPWVVGSAYWTLRKTKGSLPAGTVFTPPNLVQEVIRRLKPGLRVVDLGAGTGMLTLTAAKRGFRVTAIEADPEMASVLDSIARILRIRDRIDLQVGDALSYSSVVRHQIMANPPYTRHHSISKSVKRTLAKFAFARGAILPKTAGHYAYFMSYAWTAKRSAREVLLVPTNWLDAKYGYNLRRMMVERGARELAVVQNENGKGVFANALTTACLVTTEANGEKNHRPPRLRFTIVGSHTGRLRKPHGRSSSAARLRKLFASNGHVPRRVKTLVDVFRVKRGIATGCNSFFVLTRPNAKEERLPQREMRAVLRRLNGRITKKDIEFVWIPNKPPSAASLRRIKKGKTRGVEKTYLCGHRKPWWRIKTSEPPAYFLSYMGRTKPILRTNSQGLLNLNNIHGFYLRKGVSHDVAEKTVRWIRSRDGIAALMKHARYYEGGLWKLEPGDVQKLKLPATLISELKIGRVLQPLKR